MTAPTLWSIPTPVSHTLSTSEGFSRHVKPESALGKALAVVGFIALLLLMYNVFSTVSGALDSGLGSRYWLPLFFSTLGENGNVNPILVAYVWGPVIALPIVLVLWVLRLATRRQLAEKVFAAYSQGGFLVKALGLPLAFNQGKVQLVPQIAMPAHADDIESAQWFVNLQQTLAAYDSRTAKPLLKSLTGTLKNVKTVVPASAVFADAPREALLMAAPAASGEATIRAITSTDKGLTSAIVNMKGFEGV
ncbi:hypothetical protein GCM10022198_16120 [Klugiella xanthotipulae]|uniref:Uncharacterized protein n=1 Tax=Klugiella xanthotipulae TaxID=244735 RepID=A0A543HH42_9MICO|nr:hypothetical protein [Klugiella xanthotipulae]TQM57650.1 hypothetical protein FB466_2645 [Klugiella xanthotipulae]